MKRIHFDLETDGFYGTYLQSGEPSGCAVIALAGDAPEDQIILRKPVRSGFWAKA